ncbi:MAG: RluA family pseudouridine synthase [Lachnospiraceae bacterium]|nr:RluA family pseudouridine synthase [Lachnospiraceae bacterium]
MIIYEDKEILVCHKPAGIPVQSASVREKDMVSILKNHMSEKSLAAKSDLAHSHKESSGCVGNAYGIPYRQTGTNGVLDLYVVHRLDQPVEGVLVFAKTRRAAADLSRQITDGSMKKTYWAVVETSPDVKLSVVKTLHAKSEERADQNGQQGSGEWHTLVDYLAKDGRNNTSYVSDQRDKAAKRAELQYRILRQWTSAQKTLALVEINLKTGRHHQIRVQMAHAGMPLYGDRKYNPQCERQSNVQTTLALCAVSLTFRHPATKKMETFTVQPSAEIFNPFLK